MHSVVVKRWLLPLLLVVTFTEGSFVVLAQDYGPDTCVQGYVWREAFDGDHVCVRPWVRQRAAADNAQALSRILQNGRCIEGYVWREANQDDHVCVTPDIRTKTRAQNERGPDLFANGSR